jgi:toxoflavin synthase
MTVEPQYDRIGSSFDSAKLIPFIQYGELPTIGRLMGDVRGRTVLDVACGTGFYSRECKRLGARRVVGVDISPVMVSAARRAEEQDKLGIEYHVHDVRTMPILGEFDLGLAVWLFNNATNEADLGIMFERVARNLSADARLIGVTSDASHVVDANDTRKYGGTMIVLGEIEGGSRWKVTLHLPDGDISFETFVLARGCYERAARQAGLALEWIPLEFSQEGLDKFGPEFWDDALRNPWAAAFHAAPVRS